MEVATGLLQRVPEEDKHELEHLVLFAAQWVEDAPARCKVYCRQHAHHGFQQRELVHAAAHAAFNVLDGVHEERRGVFDALLLQLSHSFLETRCANVA